jgi:tRNA pseudouridine55 synthase
VTSDICGILNVDKPPGLSSARVVGQVKRLLPKGTKIGHAGTLDPFATGVLLLLIGRATKQCERLMDEPKQYDSTIKFGATTETDDPEAPEIPWQRKTPDAPLPPREEVEARLRSFVGEILQRPPPYSAMKVGGRRAYQLARKGELVEMPPRKVKVYAAELLSFEYPVAAVRIDCGRGTYIRSIARDLGAALDVGGYLTALRRTRVGPFEASAAVAPKALKTLSQEELARLLTPMESK